MPRTLLVSITLTAACVFAEYFARDGFIYDSAGRASFFHGTNFVEKGYPWYPEVLTSEDNIKQMADWGFNTARLGVMWTGVNPERGVFNETYIQTIDDILTKLEAHGIHALIDVHQDVLSSHFCLYDGAPTWIVDMSTSYNHSFPWPLQWDGANPCPADRSWASNYFAEETGAAFQDLYDNANGMRDYFGEFWSKVAASFKHHDILGWEIINEPWAGNIYSQPSLLLPGVAGRDNLQPFYDAVASRIREESQSHLVFYEPVTWGMIFNGTLTGSGFTAVPGGAEYANKSVFSFHYYCWWYSGSGEALEKRTCDERFGPKVFDQVAEDVRVLTLFLLPVVDFDGGVYVTSAPAAASVLRGVISLCRYLPIMF
jgi:endoglycosylceramidase